MSPVATTIVSLPTHSRFVSVLPGVCLSVCPLTITSRKNYPSDLREKFIKDVSVDKEELIKL